MKRNFILHHSGIGVNEVPFAGIQNHTLRQCAFTCMIICFINGCSVFGATEFDKLSHTEKDTE